MGPDLELDGNDIEPTPAPVQRRWQMSVWGLMKLVLALACFFGWIAGESRRVRPAERARQVQCANDLKQIAMALHCYHQQYGMLPPAYLADATGRPMHSWRVLLLPFLEAQSLYDQYDFREPWNGPNNSKLLTKMPYFYSCPSQPPTPPKPDELRGDHRAGHVVSGHCIRQLG
jgi:hypothetical protein